MKRYIKSTIDITPEYAVKRIIAALSIKRDKKYADYDVATYNDCIDVIKKVADDLGIKY